MSVDTNPQDAPAYCVLAHRTLDDMRALLTSVDTKVDALKEELNSPVGYIPRIRTSLELHEQTLETHSSAIHDLWIAVKALTESQNKLALKVGVIMAPLAALVGGIVGAVVKGL